VIRAFLAVALLCTVALACASPAPFARECAETPTTSTIVNGQTLWGKADGDILLEPFRDVRGDRVLIATAQEKMRVVVAHPIIPTTDAERIPSTLDVVGRNTMTGTNKTFHLSRHDSELGIGVEWGTNFEFPDAGCWELSVRAPRNAPAKIVVRVARS
jgi:hypothetical protein